MGTAGWIAYPGGKSFGGKTHPALDPLTSQLPEADAASGDGTERLVENSIRLEQFFGVDLKDNAELKVKLTDFVRALMTYPALDGLKSFLARKVQAAA